MRTLIADRKPLIREALAALIRVRLPRFDVATVPTLSEGTGLMGRTPFGVLILEAEQVAGDRLLDAIRLIHPGWRVVLLHQAVACGTTSACDAQWDGETDGEAMVADILRLSGVRAALAGQAPVAMPAVAMPAWQAPAPAPMAPTAPAAAEHGAAESGPAARGLTRRQIDVLGLLSEGRSTKEIARSLNLGVGTIKAHLDGLYRTLGVHNRTAAVSLVRQLPPTEDHGNVIRLGARVPPRAQPNAAERVANAG
ncbi:MAG TPA: response regulator transcription factor [Acetobacteraceae bacterium]|nr:response regulator transcription factor [Acetobacteraceae bacterium]